MRPCLCPIEIQTSLWKIENRNSKNGTSLLRGPGRTAVPKRGRVSIPVSSFHFLVKTPPPRAERPFQQRGSTLRRGVPLSRRVSQSANRHQFSSDAQSEQALSRAWETFSAEERE